MVSSEDKKVWLGLKQPQTSQAAARPIIEVIENEIGYDTYKSDVENISSLTEHETYLTDNGFSQDEAEELNGRIESTYGDWSTWQSFLDTEDPTIEETYNTFESVTEITGANGAAGIRVFDEPGTSYDGVSLPVGSVEVFGSEVHFSKKGGDGTREEIEQTNPPEFEYSNLVVNDTDLATDGITGVLADITNTGGAAGNAAPVFIVDGEVVDQNPDFVIEPGETRVASFAYEADGFGTAYVSIGPLEPVLVSSTAVEVDR